MRDFCLALGAAEDQIDDIAASFHLAAGPSATRAALLF